MTFRALRLLAGLSVLCCSADAIVRRHDRDDSAYQELARAPQWRAAVGVGGIAVGTLIDESWVLTAAHATDILGPFERIVRIGDRIYPIDAVWTHADYNGTTSGTDIALVRLGVPVKDVPPAALYEDSDEEGREVIFVGNGLPGVGLTGPMAEATRLWRAARNRVSVAQGPTLRFNFDAPPGGEELEGISGPGDSGGPAFIEKDGRVFVAGVSSANAPGSGSGLCTYGTVEVYCRVSALRGWIADVRSGRIPADNRWSEVKVLAKTAWPDDERFCLVREWVDLRNRGDAEALVRYMKTAGSPAYHAARSPEARLRGAQVSWATHGVVEPVAYAQATDGTLTVLARTAQRGRWVDLVFTFAKDAMQFDRAGTLDLGERTDLQF